MFHKVERCITSALCFDVDPWINACGAARQIAHRLVSSSLPLPSSLTAKEDEGQQMQMERWTRGRQTPHSNTIEPTADISPGAAAPVKLHHKITIVFSSFFFLFSSLWDFGSTFDTRRYLSDVFPTPPPHPYSAPRRGCAGSCAQCCIYRCHHPTTAHGVLHRLHLLQ